MTANHNLRKKKNLLHSAIVVGGFLCAAAGLIAAASAPPLPTVAHVDLSRYLGRWFEIARYPNRFERKCDRNVTAEYAMKENGRIRVVNTCLTARGRPDRAEGAALVVDKSTNAKLKVTFFWPFYGNYWVIDLGPNYEYAVVGEPSRRYLWILSRSPTMQDATYRDLLSRLAAKGYDPQKLMRTTQSESPLSAPPAPR